MSLGIQIEGIDTASKRLRSIPVKGLTQIANGVNKAAAVVEAEAKRNCPVDTGNLRSSIHTDKAKVEGQNVVATVGTSVEYAPYVEFGTGRRGGYPYKTDIPLSYGNKPGQAAQPFLGKSLHENKRLVRQIIKESMDKAVSNV